MENAPPKQQEPIPDFIYELPENATVFEDLFLAKLEDLRYKYLNTNPKDRTITMSEIIEVIRIMQYCEMDCHIAIMGQNGVGKTYLLLMIMKAYLGGNWLPNLLLAKHDTNDFINFLLTHNSTLMGVDEFNQYLDYKEHMDEEQKHLIRQIELSRDNRVAIVGCIRDARKLTINYRHGKLSIILWVIDRYTNKGSYAAVLIANPAVESSDKFGLSLIAGDIISFKDLRDIIENRMYSFVGYMKIPDAKTLLTSEEIKTYKTEKQLAKMYAHLKHIFTEYRKKHIYLEDVMLELERAKPILGEERVKELLKKIPEQAKTSHKKKESVAEQIEKLEDD
jgi:hypothetical protein